MMHTSLQMINKIGTSGGGMELSVVFFSSHPVEDGLPNRGLKPGSERDSAAIWFVSGVKGALQNVWCLHSITIWKRAIDFFWKRWLRIFGRGMWGREKGRRVDGRDSNSNAEKRTETIQIEQNNEAARPNKQFFAPRPGDVYRVWLIYPRSFQLFHQV
jgi:hypothetical protein